MYVCDSWWIFICTHGVHVYIQLCGPPVIYTYVYGLMPDLCLIYVYVGMWTTHMHCVFVWYLCVLCSCSIHVFTVYGCTLCVYECLVHMCSVCASVRCVCVCCVWIVVCGCSLNVMCMLYVQWVCRCVLYVNSPYGACKCVLICTWWLRNNPKTLTKK